jgi:hypothetical protein
MPGALLHVGATVVCAHPPGGQAAPTAPPPNPRVLVSGQPIVTLTTPYTIAGCPFVPPGGNGPCATAQWTSGAQRVRANNVPVLLVDSQSTCVPTGTPLIPRVTQTRVVGV